MAKKRTRETSPSNYLKLNQMLQATLMRIKEKAKEQTGRSFGTHAERGTAAYERLIRETLDAALLLTSKDRRLNAEEKDMIKRRLTHDYEYGFNMRNAERRQFEKEEDDAPVLDKRKVTARMKEIDELKQENIRRTAEKFLKYRQGR